MNRSISHPFVFLYILLATQLTFTQVDNYKIRLSAILVKDKNKAELIVQKLNQGAEFSQLARQYSIGPGKEEDGDLGYFYPDDVMQELKTIVVNLPIGKHSNIIETNQGFFILMKTEEQPIPVHKEDNNISYLLEKGIEELNRENYETALKILKQAEAIEPDNQDVHYILGFLYEELAMGSEINIIKSSLSQIKKASSHFKKVIEISPMYEVELLEHDPYFKISSLWGSLATAYIYKGKIDSATWAFKKGQKEGGFFPAILEYVKNMMNSCEKDAILFTDSYWETFCMWFLQYLESHRKDITIVNLNLFDSDWYLQQLKNSYPFGFNNVPLDLTIKQIENWGSDYHLITSNIIESNQWTRPVYFSVTVAQVVLEPYLDSLTAEGLVYHMFPDIAQELSPEILEQNCIEVYTYNAVYDEHLDFIPELISLYQNYRYDFIDLVSTFNKPDSVIEILKLMELKIPENAVPYQPDVLDYQGVIYRKNFLYKEAVLALKKAIKIDPNYADAYYNLGLIYLDLGDINSAHKEYKVLKILDSDLAKDLKKRLMSKISIVISGGWNIPTGKVHNIGGQVRFPPVQATDIYKQGFVLGFGGDGIIPLYPYPMMEADLNIRVSPITARGQELANKTRDDGKEVNLIYASFDLFVGKRFIVGDVTRSRFHTFAGISIGWIGLMLYAGEEGEDTETDNGIGLAAKTGVDWFLGRSRKIFLRFGIRYQMLTSGVNAPKDLTFFIGGGIPISISD